MTSPTMATSAAASRSWTCCTVPNTTFSMGTTPWSHRARRDRLDDIPEAGQPTDDGADSPK